MITQMTETMSIHVVCLGSAAVVLGWNARTITIATGATLADMVQQLEREHPALASARDRVRYAINNSYANMSASLSAGDEVAVIPPVSGG